MSGHMKGSEKMPIARFVNAEEIVQPLPCKTKKIIPYVWIEEWIGEDVYRGLVLDAPTLAQLDVLRLNENMSRSEFIGKIINEYKVKEKDVHPD